MTSSRSGRRRWGVAALAVVLAVAGCGGLRGRRGDDAGSTVPTMAPPVTLAPPVRPAVEPRGRTVDGTLRTADGRDRTYHVYESTSVAAGGPPVPLLVALHGGTGSGTQFERQTGFDGLAEANGFVVVYPDGVGTGPGDAVARTWNAGGCCGPAQRGQVDDVAFVRALVDELRGRFPLDGDRIFAVGHSNGGMLAYRLACQGPGPFAAVAVQSSALLVDGCRPERPVSLEHLHGTADRNVPLTGGVGEDAISGVSYPPPRDGAVAVAAADGCPAHPAPARGDPGLTIETWSPCASGTEVRFVTVAGAGHPWMGSARAGEAGGAVDASTELLAFLFAHPRAR